MRDQSLEVARVKEFGKYPKGKEKPGRETSTCFHLKQITADFGSR
jgi:hypothetical protein